MGDSFFKLIIRDESWDVRSEAKRLGFLFQLFIDAKKPNEVFIKYKTVKDAQRARTALAKNENVVRVESLETWDIRPKRTTVNTDADDMVSCAGSTTSRYTNHQHKGPTQQPQQHNWMGNGQQMSEPMPLMMGLFNMCSTCHKGGAAYQCFVCGTYYCGEICQRNDWPAHIVQCLPRLVRTQSGFSCNETQSMGYPNPQMMPPYGNLNNTINIGPVQADRKQNQPTGSKRVNQPTGRKESGSNHKQTSNNHPPTNSKSEQHQKLVEASPSKTTPVCTVPTNVLKNLSLKRHQEQEGGLEKPAAAGKDASEKGETSASTIEGIITKQSSKLVKRIQQKVAAPKREIEYSPFPREGEYVKIAYVTDSMLYVYRSGQEANGQSNRYLDFVKRSIECARNVKQMLQAAPNVGDVAFGPFDGDYYRAVVKSIEGTRVSVFFPDFGNTQTVEWKEMKEIPNKEIQYGMCYTHGVMIDGVPKFSPAVRKYLSELLELDEFELIKVSDNKHVKTIGLRHVQELYHLSTKILGIAENEQKMEKPIVKEAPAIVDPASYAPVTAEDFEEHDLPMNKEILLTIVDASELNISNQISVILNSDNAAFSKVISDCNEYGNKDPNPYQPKIENEAFLIQFDEVWCRAMVASNDVEVMYYLLDLGIIRATDKHPKLRRYPAGLTRRVYVSECFVDNPDALGSSEAVGKNEQFLGRTVKATMQLDSDGEGTRLKIHSFVE
ncbi:uncharacterized protein LOC128297321 [Anopheles moucheti]|uniref:uncharacterized protein LOC128297321 n=1 Tax=Anopheles moucheti TaxID=186751 RepID=UPI0022F042A5|nr:uncharacterized protein LOC128297321 [Anopheles moucheti]